MNILSRCFADLPRAMAVTCRKCRTCSACSVLACAVCDMLLCDCKACHSSAWADAVQSKFLSLAASQLSYSAHNTLLVSPTFCGPGSDLKLTTTSPFFTLKHCTTPDMSPTATFCVLFSPGGRTCSKQLGRFYLTCCRWACCCLCWKDASAVAHQEGTSSGSAGLQQVQTMQFQLHDCCL
jgi:hypothetical protein